MVGLPVYRYKFGYMGFFQTVRQHWVSIILKAKVVDFKILFFFCVCVAFSLQHACKVRFCHPIVHRCSTFFNNLEKNYNISPIGIGFIQFLRNNSTPYVYWITNTVNMHTLERQQFSSLKLAVLYVCGK